MGASRDLKIYLHSNATRLQTLVHVLAAACFFTKAFKLHLNEPFYLFWYYFYISFGVLLSVAILFQALNRFGFRHLAAIINIMAGVVLTVESLVKITENTKKFYALNFLAGLIFILFGILEDRIRKIPYIAFNKGAIYGRRSLLSSFHYNWKEVDDINFRHNRIKITQEDGEVVKYRIARQSTGGIIFKSAEYFCQQVLAAHKQKKARPTQG